MISHLKQSATAPSFATHTTHTSGAIPRAAKNALAPLRVRAPLHCEALLHLNLAGTPKPRSRQSLRQNALHAASCFAFVFGV